MNVPQRLKALGYRLVRNYYCPIRRRRMPYAVLPNNRTGSINVFDTLAQVEKYVKDVEQIRSWQED
jgi:hypothetical protein